MDLLIRTHWSESMGRNRILIWQLYDS
jgi:hypothetical protein